MKKILLIILFLTFLVGIFFYLIKRPPSTVNNNLNIQEGIRLPEIQTSPQRQDPDVEVIADNLQIPWEVAFLPDKEMLVTERPGRLLKIGKDKKVYQIEGVRHIGEGGLLGITLHPNFAENNYIYLYLTSSSGTQIVNRVERYHFDNDKLTDRELILDGVRGSSNHDGGRIEFGPDRYLYITTGDAEKPSLAQDKNSLNGKILRIKDDGSIPPDNPFGSAVYSYGHRNVQGIAWDNEGRLWATEHGRSGVLSGFDELNLIEPGKNYGWPTIQGDKSAAGMVNPIIHSGASETWAPSDVEFIGGDLFFTGLRGSALYQVKLSGVSVTSIIKHFDKEFGRLRAARMGTDGYLYITTSNRDGRGTVNQRDDKLIRINPNVFTK